MSSELVVGALAVVVAIVKADNRALRKLIQEQRRLGCKAYRHIRKEQMRGGAHNAT